MATQPRDEPERAPEPAEPPEPKPWNPLLGGVWTFAEAFALIVGVGGAALVSGANEWLRSTLTGLVFGVMFLPLAGVLAVAARVGKPFAIHESLLFALLLGFLLTTSLPAATLSVRFVASQTVGWAVLAGFVANAAVARKNVRARAVAERKAEHVGLFAYDYALKVAAVALLLYFVVQWIRSAW